MPADGDNLTLPSTGTPTVLTNNLTAFTCGKLSLLAGTTLGGNGFSISGGIDSLSIPLPTFPDVIVNPALTLTADQTFTCLSGTTRFNGAVDFSGRRLTFTTNGTSTVVLATANSGVVVRSRLIKNGGGTLRLAGAVTTSSAVDLNVGTLDVDGTLPSSVIVTGGRLMGSGSIGGLNATAGDIEPDASGLSASGTATLGGTSRCVFHLTSAGQANTLTASAVTISGATLAVDATGVLSKGQVFRLITKTGAGAIAGTFFGLAQGTEVEVGSPLQAIGTISYTGGDLNDIALTITSAVHTWDGGATANDNWTNPTNWVGDIAPVAGDILVFPDGIGLTDRGVNNDFPNDTTFRRLVFIGAGYTVRGNRFRLTHGLETDFNIETLADTTDLDTSLVLAQDQTFTLLRTLHLDALDEIDTNGKTLNFAGKGGLVEGRIRGTGGVRALLGSSIDFHGRNDYSGPTVIAGDGMISLKRGILFEGQFDEGHLGDTAAGTNIFGVLSLENRTIVPFDIFDVPEQLTIMPEGEVMLQAGRCKLSGPIQLNGPGAMHVNLGVNGGDLELAGPISGTGDLHIVRSSDQPNLEITGSAANTFSGSMSIFGAVVADKSPGVAAVPCENLTLLEGVPTLSSLFETRQDEQIADNCQVFIEQSAELRIGNLIGLSRTETIGAVTMSGSGEIKGNNGSLLKIAGNISLVSTPGEAFANIRVPLSLAGAPCLLDVADTMRLVFAEIAPVSKTGSGLIRKTGTGELRFLSTTAIPMELAGGRTTVRANIGHAIKLDGGTLEPDFLDVTNVEIGPLASLAGGGRVDLVPSATGALRTPSVAFNGATTLNARIGSDGQGGARSGRLAVVGTVNLGGALLTLQDFGVNPPTGTQLRVIDKNGAGPITGTFTGLPEGAFLPFGSGSGGFTISYVGEDGNDVVLTKVAVPPAIIPLVITGITIAPLPLVGNPNAISVTARSSPGSSNTLQKSTDLITWQTVETKIAEPNGNLSFGFQEPQATLRLFVRLRSP